MVQIQNSSAHFNTLAAGLSAVIMLSSGNAVSAGYDHHQQIQFRDGHHKELITRFSEGRSGDIQWKVTKSNSTPNIDILEPSVMVNTVIGALGLGMTDLEKVLKVKRATVYNWRKGGDVRAEDSLLRLQDVHSIAKEIAKFNERPFGKRAKTHLINGKSYLDLLSEDDLDARAIIEIAQLLSNQENARLKAKNEISHNLNDIESISGGWQQT